MLPTQGLSEPSGLSYDPQSGCVYVADTNNHAVRVVKLGESGESWEVGVVDRARLASNTGVSWLLTEVNIQFIWADDLELSFAWIVLFWWLVLNESGI